MKQKNKQSGLLNTIHEIIEKGRKSDVLQLYTDDEFYNGRNISINGRELINFGSCSYMGLELDDRLKRAAIEAIEKYGIQFSSSRTYVSCTLYNELEGLVKQIFNAHPVLTPTTTLGHQAVIPVAVEPGDLIILDQQVHASVQYAAQNMQLKGVIVTVVRHNNLAELEELINTYSQKFHRIWYMADGIYSMYGDYMPVEPLMDLLNKYPKFHLYVDDAHGMSWTGRNGRGFVLGKVDLHSKMIVGTSFAKGFGTGGGVFLFSNAELSQKIRNCGGPLIFSGPNQIPVLAASIASAKIHLSEEIYKIQLALKEKILYCHELMLKYNLPVVSNPETPIKFIGLGLTRVGYNMVKRMIEAGYYCNLAIFPAVPETCTGLRFTITMHHTLKDIENLVFNLAYHFPKALSEEGRTREDIQRAFRKVANFKAIDEQKSELPEQIKNNKYRIQHETSIEFIPQPLWDNLLNNGTFDWNWLLFLEQTFSDNKQPEHNWEFHYYIIWESERPVLATFFTSALNKDDMLAHSSVSYQIELKRIHEPYYLSSKTFMMGSLITEGQHLFIDRLNPEWKEVFMLLLDAVWQEQINQQANSLCLRDFYTEDEELQNFLMDQGFIKANLPDNHFIESVSWQNSESYLRQFKSRERWYLKDCAVKYQPFFEVEIPKNITEDDIETWYELYRNVKGRNFELNTFSFPKKLFTEMAKNKNCEIMQLRLKSSNPEDNGKIVAVTFNMITASKAFCGIIIGMDYNFLKTHNVYKQTLYQSLLRAGKLNVKKVFFGFTASDIKRKFGAKAVPQAAYFQMQDNFSLSVINSIANTGRLTEVEKKSMIRNNEKHNKIKEVQV